MSTDELDELFSRWRGQHPPGQFAPAAAVRRRGRQRVHRQAAVAGVAVLAVLGLGAGSLATVLTGLDQDPVAPAATPTPGVGDAIPPQWLLAEADLGAEPDWQEAPNELLEADWFWQAECDGNYRPADYPSLAHRQDVATIGWADEAEPVVRVDQLVELFDQADQAVANLADIRAVMAACGRDPAPDDQVAPINYQVVGTGLAGDESLLVELQAYHFDGDQLATEPFRSYVAVVRVGPVVTTLVSQDGDLLREVAPRAAARLPADPGNPPPPPPPPPAPTSCTVERLPGDPSWTAGPQPTKSLVTAADPTGSLITGRGYPDSAFPSFALPLVIWRDGDPEFLESPGSDPSLRSINSSGVAVGTAWDEEPTPWVYQDGELTPLPGVESGHANGINERGDVAGAQLFGEEVPGLPVWWPAGGSEPLPLPLPLPAGGASGEAQDIDEDGTIVGLYAVDGVEHPYVWFPDGTAGELPLPAGRSPSARAFHISHGWVAGTVDLPDGGVRVVRWHLPTGEVREFPQFASAPYAVNAAGWLVGSNADNKALLATGDGDLILPGLAGGGDHAVAISDDGRFLAGQSEDEAGDTHAVRWRCQ